jgi:hypothetical protein
VLSLQLFCSQLLKVMAMLFTSQIQSQSAALSMEESLCCHKIVLHTQRSVALTLASVAQ